MEVNDEIRLFSRTGACELRGCSLVHMSCVAFCISSHFSEIVFVAQTLVCKLFLEHDLLATLRSVHGHVCLFLMFSMRIALRGPKEAMCRNAFSSFSLQGLESNTVASLQ
jgi:hypothetical protein